MKANSDRVRGFTLIELMVSIAVLAVLTAIAFLAYDGYTDKARGVDIVEQYHNQRVAVSTNAQGAVRDSCAELARSFGNTKLSSSYATLSHGFEATSNGYRPVLNVCAQIDSHGIAGVKAARAAYETLAKSGVVEKGPVLLDSVVSYALRLTDNEQALCKNNAAQPANVSACGSTPASTQTPPPVQVPPQAQAPAQVQVPPQAQIPAQTPPQAQIPAQVPPQAQAPSQVQTPLPVSGQGPAQATVRPPAIASGSGSSGTGPQRPNAPTLDAAQLASDLQSIRAMDFLNQRDKETVAAAATQMAINTGYAQVVREALSKTPPRQPIQIPTSAQAGTTIRFSAEMRSALEAAYLEAARRLCISRYGPNYPSCG